MISYSCNHCGIATNKQKISNPGGEGGDVVESSFQERKARFGDIAYRIFVWNSSFWGDGGVELDTGLTGCG